MATGALFTLDFPGPRRSPRPGAEATQALLAIGWAPDLAHFRAGVDPDKSSLEQGHQIPNVTVRSPHWGSFIATDSLGSFFPSLV